MRTYFLGIDPGETTGLCLLTCEDMALIGYDIAQCNGDAVPAVISGLTQTKPIDSMVWAMEKFVVSNRSARSGKASSGAYTRELIGEILVVADMAGIRRELRSASEVKAWATNARISAVRIKGVGGHSIDGARHGMFSAVKNGRLKDPLSGK